MMTGIMVMVVCCWTCSISCVERLFAAEVGYVMVKTLAENKFILC